MKSWSWPVLSVCNDRFNKFSVSVSDTGSIQPEPGELVAVANNCIKSLWFSAIKINRIFI